jgi:hypothetical protein
MSKRLTTFFTATVAAALLLAVAASVAAAAPAAPASAKVRVVPIAMRDPGCHWFNVGGKYTARLTVSGKTAFRNLDEAALIFKGKSFLRRVAVGKTLAIAKPGVYHITMVGQPADDNTLLLVVK